MLAAGLVRRRCAIATTAVLLLVTACSKTVSAFDRRATYPDSCPMGIDTTGQPSRLCVPNASGLKGWTPTYNMSMSTIIMPCNTTGYFEPSAAARYGIVDVDWSNAKQQWAHATPMDCEACLVEQARLIKAQNPRTKVWVYRNLVKATPWYASVREKICDPAYAGWFLRFNQTNNSSSSSVSSATAAPPHVAKCDDAFSPPKCSEFYHDAEKSLADGALCPGGQCDCGCVPCGYYIWDHRNASLRAWLVSYAAGATSVEDPSIDGVFLDDYWAAPGGPAESGKHILADIGLSPQDVVDISDGFVLSTKSVQQAVLDKGGYVWQLFSPGHGTTGSDPVGGAAGCAAALRARCVRNDTLQHSALMMNAGKTSADFMPNLAAFLLIRGPYAWFGNAWQGCDNIPARRPEVDRDYGTPTGACAETHSGSGVFTRSWTRADVTVDCNTWTGKIDSVGV